MTPRSIQRRVRFKAARAQFSGASSFFVPPSSSSRRLSSDSRYCSAAASVRSCTFFGVPTSGPNAVSSTFIVSSFFSFFSAVSEPPQPASSRAAIVTPIARTSRIAAPPVPVRPASLPPLGKIEGDEEIFEQVIDERELAVQPVVRVEDVQRRRLLAREPHAVLDRHHLVPPPM